MFKEKFKTSSIVYFLPTYALSLICLGYKFITKTFTYTTTYTTTYLFSTHSLLLIFFISEETNTPKRKDLNNPAHRLAYNILSPQITSTYTSVEFLDVEMFTPDNAKTWVRDSLRHTQDGMIRTLC